MPPRRKLPLSIGRRSGTDLKAGINARRLSNGLEDFKEYFDDSSHCDQTSGKVDAPEQDCHVSPVARFDTSGFSDAPTIHLPAVPETGEADNERTGGIGERPSRQSQQSSHGLQDTLGVKNRKKFRAVYLSGKKSQVSPLRVQRRSSRQENPNVQSPSRCLPNFFSPSVLCSTRLSEDIAAPDRPKDIFDGDFLLDGCLPGGRPSCNTRVSHDARQQNSGKANLDKRRDSLKPRKPSSSELCQVDQAVAVHPLVSGRADDVPSAQNGEGERSSLHSVSKTAAPLEPLATSVDGQEILDEQGQQSDASQSPHRIKVKERTVASCNVHHMSNNMSVRSTPKKAAPAKSVRVERGVKVTAPVDTPPTAQRRQKKSSHPAEVHIVHKVARVENNEVVLRPQCDRIGLGSVPGTRHSASTSSAENEESCGQNMPGANPLRHSLMQEVLPSPRLSGTRSALKVKKIHSQPFGAIVVQGDLNVHHSGEESVLTQMSNVLHTSRTLRNDAVSPKNHEVSEKAPSLLGHVTSAMASRAHPVPSAQGCSPAPASDEVQNTNTSPRQQLKQVEYSEPPVMRVKPVANGRSTKSRRNRAVKRTAASESSKGKLQLKKRKVATVTEAAQHLSDVPCLNSETASSLRRGTRTRQPPPPRNGLYVPVYEYTEDGPVFKRYDALVTLEDPYVWAYSSKTEKSQTEARRTKRTMAVSDTAASKGVSRGKVSSRKKNAKQQKVHAGDSFSVAVATGPGLLDFMETSHNRDFVVRRTGSYKFLSENQSDKVCDIATQYLLNSCHAGFIHIYPGKSKQPSDILHSNILFTALDNPVCVTTISNIVTKLCKGDSCLLPKGTSYSIENLSEDHEAELQFLVIPNL